MIWILLLYVLSLLISIVGVYFLVKRDGGNVGDFLEPLPYLFIPVFNIMAIVAGTYFFIEKFLQKDESWQNFKNKKL
jgi:uncharacterized membrane protein